MLALLSFSVVSAVNSNQDSITLLAVSESDDGTLSGSTATMYLQIKPGSGAIFIESYPASKIDTQVATRVANEIACEFTDKDCSKYDFFYTIRADSPIIGGPSGGGATAVLTLAVLEHLEIRKDIAMTGAISSGGVIGPVAGIPEKVLAAQNSGNEIAIVPILAIKNESDIEEENPFNISLEKTNQTSEVFKPLTFQDIKNYTVQIEPVLTLYEALNFATTKDIKPKPDAFSVSPYYKIQMNKTGSQLCQRTQDLLAETLPNQENNTLYIQAMSFLNKSDNAPFDAYYTKASFCFSANLQLRQLLLENVSQEVLLENYKRLNDSLSEFSKAVETQPLNTLADLETYVIVTERLLEVEEYLDELNKSNISSNILGAGIERYASAVAWSGFFGLEGSENIELNEASLRYACNQEVQKVESRLNYLRTLLPESYLTRVVNDLDVTYRYQREHSYELCLFKATKTKAFANLFLSSLMVDNDKLPDLIQAKQDRTKTVLSENKDRFAILGYSYYEYSNAFVDEDPYSGLVFAEYALAFSDVSGYFPPKKSLKLPENLVDQLIAFALGIIVGALMILLIAFKSQNKITKTRKRR